MARGDRQMSKLIIENIDGVIKSFFSDGEILEFVGSVYDENEEKDTVLFRPNSVPSGIAYIRDYCENLCINEYYE